MGVWVNGGYHVWPDFYHEDYGWVPVDPTFKNSNPNADYFGRYDGNLIILSQGLTSFSESDIEIRNKPLQAFYYWYWYTNGSGIINGVHKTSKDYQVNAINVVEANEKKTESIYNIIGIKQNSLCRGVNIVNGKKIYMR
jgi:phenylalanine-4-hydroxylase